MTFDVVTIYLLAMLAAAASWLVPQQRAMDAMALFTLAVVAAFSWPTAAWLIVAITLTHAALALAERSGRRDIVVAILAIVLLGAFVAAQFTHGILWLGASFFTLRLLHVVGEWWTGRIPAPSLGDLLRYQLFLPVMVVGPIHRLPNFQRQVTRRRWDTGDFASGLERCLLGFVMAHFLGEFAVGRIGGHLETTVAEWPAFASSWALSAVGWVRLFFVFAGLTSVALGASLMAGLKLEENFDRPWRATSLLDFWNRWHMSLTSWSRDYAYKPVMALTRKPLVGLVAAMLVIGLWHAISLYYVLWSFWQALGIVLSRQAGKVLPVAKLPGPARAVIVPLAILGWLSAARPFITLILGVDYDADNALF